VKVNTWQDEAGEASPHPGQAHSALHLVDGDASFVVVHAAEHQIHTRRTGLGIRQGLLESIKALQVCAVGGSWRWASGDEDADSSQGSVLN